MRTTIKQKLVSPVLMWIIVLAGVFIAFRYLPVSFLFRRNVFTSSLLFLAILNWLYLFYGAITLNRTAARSAAAVRSLATTGVYGKVRHPIYSADIFLAWGIFLFWPTTAMLASVVWLTAVMLIWMKLEESALIERFGDEYRSYKQGTPMVIPHYFRRS